MKKSLAATAIAATTLGGVAAGATLFVPGVVGAQDGAEEVAPDPGAKHSESITEALQPLVDDGTLTASQVDAVIGALEAARTERSGRGGPGGPGGPGGSGELAEILGLESEALGEALRSGQSLADVAAEQGVDTQDLIDAIVTATEERVAEALDSGHMEQEKADEILDGAADRAEDMVSGEIELGRRGRGGPGHGGPGGDAAPGAETDTGA